MTPSPRSAAHIRLVPVTATRLALFPGFPPKPTPNEDDFQSAFADALLIHCQSHRRLCEFDAEDVTNADAVGSSIARATLTTQPGRSVTLTISVSPDCTPNQRRAWASACLLASHGLVKQTLTDTPLTDPHGDETP